MPILTLSSQYIFSVFVFVVENRDLIMSNRDIHSFNTRNSFDLHLPAAYLTTVQRGVLYSGCKVYNSLPIHIKSHSENSRHLKKILKNYVGGSKIFRTGAAICTAVALASSTGRW